MISLDYLKTLQDAHDANMDDSLRGVIRAMAESALGAERNALEGQIMALECALGMPNNPVLIEREAEAYIRVIRRAQAKIDGLRKEVKEWGNRE